MRNDDAFGDDQRHRIGTTRLPYVSVGSCSKCYLKRRIHLTLYATTLTSLYETRALVFENTIIAVALNDDIQ